MAGVFPVGLPIGVVKTIDEDEIEIIPINDIERLEFVKIVDYGIFQDMVKMSQTNEGK